MGHGIFPDYGTQFIKSWQHLLSKEERKLVFYTSKKGLKKVKFKDSEEEVVEVKKRKRGK